MMASIWLWRKPGDQLGEGEQITGEKLHECAEYFAAYLHEVGETVEKLTANGWIVETSLYDLMLYHPDIRKADEAKEVFVQLGIDPEIVSIDDEDDDCEDDEETVA